MIWLGGRRRKNGRLHDVHWAVTGERLNSGFHAWHKDQPDNKDGNQNCLWSKDGLWLDRECSDSKAVFVCEFAWIERHGSNEKKGSENAVIQCQNLCLEKCIAMKELWVNWWNVWIILINFPNRYLLNGVILLLLLWNTVSDEMSKTKNN